MGLVRDFFEGVELGRAHMRVREFLELDRDVACRGISQLVATMSEGQLDEFEQQFLAHSANLWGSDYRCRAMELYAWLKVAETLRNGGHFRGFLTSSAGAG